MKTQAKMMASYTYVSRELVSKTGEYTQGTRQQNIQHEGFYCNCKITRTLKIKKKNYTSIVDLRIYIAGNKFSAEKQIQLRRSINKLKLMSGLK